jgi:hypothetical protein
MTMTWLDAVDTIRKARNKAAGKPLQNNTRLYVRGEGDEREFGVVLHGTEVVTIRSDDTYVLRSGGYQTPTTADRIHTYSPAKQFSERGDWYVWMKPIDRDPRPDRVERAIPKPYEATDPGPEPTKSTEGCLAGQMVATEHVDELVEVYRRDMRDGDEIVEKVSDGFEDSYDRLKVKRTWTDHIYYSEGHEHGWDEGWANLPDNRHVHTSSFLNDDNERVKKVQCPHCAEFDAIHEVWRQAMHGDRWHRRFDGANGYATYAAMMKRFGSTEAWQAAYIEDFRARRAYLKAEREWELRNRVLFYDGIVVDSEGYAPRVRQDGPSPAKLRRHEAKVKRIKDRIDKYVNAYIKALAKGMPMPGNGDCWYCLLRDENGKTWGDHGDHNHLEVHMEDRYYVPMLAVNALRDTTSLADVGIAIWLNMNPEANVMGGGDTKQYDIVARAIRNYMRKRLVPEAPTS